MTRTKRWLVGTGLFVVAGTGAILAIDAFGWLDFEPVIEVTVAPVSRATVVARLWAEGKVASAHEATLSAAGSGQLVALAVAEGDTVQQGQLLMRIEASSLTARATAAQYTLKSKRAQIAQATALCQQQAEAAAQASRDWQRQAALYSQGVISGQAYEEARALYGAAIARAREAENQLQAMRSATQVAVSQMSQAAGNLRETTIYAPFGGVISRLYVTRGQHVVGTSMVAGTPLLDLFQPTELEVRATVAEDALTQLQLGDSAGVELLHTGPGGASTHLPGVVSYLGVQPLEPVKSPATYSIRVRLPHPELAGHPRLGTHANLSIVTARREQVPSLPLGAVTSRPKRGGGGVARINIQQEMQAAEAAGERPRRRSRAGSQENVVFVVQGNIVSRRPIKVGVSGESRIEVLSKFPLGTLIVSGPYGAVAQGLHTGAKISIKQEAALDRTVRYGPTVEF